MLWRDEDMTLLQTDKYIIVCFTPVHQYTSVLHSIPSLPFYHQFLPCVCSARNKDQRLVSCFFFLKIGYFLGYWLLSHWKCTGNLANQNEFFSSKCWNCSETSQWLAVISGTVMYHTMCYNSLWYHHHQWYYNYGMVECYSNLMVTQRVTR